MNDEEPIKSRFLQNLNEVKRSADYRWEHRVVSRLLTVLDVAWKRKELLDAEEEATGESRLSLATFHEAFPDLPFRLLSHALYRIESDVNVAKLLTKFSKTRLMKTYDEYADYLPEDMSEDKAYGLVVPWPYVKNGFILHDMAVDFSSEGTRLVIRDGDRVLILEPFDNFLEHALRG